MKNNILWKTSVQVETSPTFSRWGNKLQESYQSALASHLASQWQMEEGLVTVDHDTQFRAPLLPFCNSLQQHSSCSCTGFNSSHPLRECFLSTSSWPGALLGAEYTGEWDIRLKVQKPTTCEWAWLDFSSLFLMCLFSSSLPSSSLSPSFQIMLHS